jgi:carbon-monoxide dehydrogenase medium subunit
MLAQAAGMIGALQTRNLGTIGGNICNAVPSADMAPPLLAAGAEAIISGSNGIRLVSLDDFFLGPRKTVLDMSEILQELRIPTPPKRTGSSYQRFTQRKALDLAVASVATVVTVDPSEHITQAKIALGAVAPTPVRAYEAEETLVDEKITPTLLTEVAEKVVQASKPISDLRAPSEFREHLLKILMKRSLLAAFQNAVAEDEVPL